MLYPPVMSAWLIRVRSDARSIGILQYPSAPYANMLSPKVHAYRIQILHIAHTVMQLLFPYPSITSHTILDSFHCSNGPSLTKITSTHGTD